MKTVHKIYLSDVLRALVKLKKKNHYFNILSYTWVTYAPSHTK
jgi:hypothetical protein